MLKNYSPKTQTDVLRKDKFLSKDTNVGEVFVVLRPRRRKMLLQKLCKTEFQ